MKFETKALIAIIAMMLIGATGGFVLGYNEGEHNGTQKGLKISECLIQEYNNTQMNDDKLIDYCIQKFK